MSLINRVLKDLERRQAPAMSPEPALPAAVHATQPLRRSAAPRVLLAIALLVVAGAVAWRFLGHAPPKTVHRDVPAGSGPDAPHAAAPAAPPAPAVPPAPGTSAQSAAAPPVATLPRVPVDTPALTEPRQAVAPQQPAPHAEAVQRAPESEVRREAPAGAVREDLASAPQPARQDLAAKREALAAGGGGERVGSIDKQVRPPSAADRAETEFRAGMEAFQAGRFDEADAAWTHALALDPASASARQALLALLLDRGDRARAEQLLEEGLQINPRQVKHAMLLARLQLERGSQTEALRTLEEGLPYAQWSADYLAMTARVMARTGRNGDAAELYRGALRLAPGNPVWEIGLGLALRADGRTAEARAAFARARESKGLTPDLQAFVERQLREMR